MALLLFQFYKNRAIIFSDFLLAGIRNLDLSKILFGPKSGKAAIVRWRVFLKVPKIQSIFSNSSYIKNKYCTNIY